MIRCWPSMTTTVSSDSEIGLKYGYRPAAWISRAWVNCRHFSNSATGVCSVSIGTGPRAARVNAVPVGDGDGVVEVKVKS